MGQDQPTLSIGDGHVVAQTFRQGMTGHLIAVWAPVACTPAAPGTNLTVEIRGLGRPTGTTFATQNFDVNTLEFLLPFGPYPARVHVRESGVRVPRRARGGGVPVRNRAIASPKESRWRPAVRLSVGRRVPGRPARTDGASGKSTRRGPTLPIGTTVDPDRPVDFMQIGRSGHQHAARERQGPPHAAAWFSSDGTALHAEPAAVPAPTRHEMMARRRVLTPRPR